MSAPLASVERAVPANDLLGETPLWCGRTQTLLWLDIDGGHVHRLHPATGQRDTFSFDAPYVGSLALTRDPLRLLLGIGASLYLFDMRTGDKELLCQVEPPGNDTRLNDGRCDARGRFWVGTMDNQLRSPSGAFYRVGAEGDCERLFGDVIVSNTVALSPAQDRLYFSDTRRFTTWQFDLDLENGRLANRRIFVDHTQSRQRPDGACVDSEGFVWTAIFGGGRVVRYSPGGAVDRIIEVPVTNPTCMCLAGPDLRTLYITTARKFLDADQLAREPWAGSVLSVQVDVPGLPEQLFGR
jgi:sugar lactone lactonase YvrE